MPAGTRVMVWKNAKDNGTSLAPFLGRRNGGAFFGWSTIVALSSKRFVGNLILQKTRRLGTIPTLNDSRSVRGTLLAAHGNGVG
jgi:hypothetical protein